MIAKAREEVIESIQALAPTLRALGIARLALFGSFARGEQGPDSDVDILVSFEEGRKTFDAYMEAIDSLEQVLGRRVELVTVESLSPHIGPSILSGAQDVPLPH